MRTTKSGHLTGTATDIRTPWRRGVAIVLILAMVHLALLPAAWAQESADEKTEHTAAQYGLGTASVFITIPYGLVKFLFATLGGIFGGFTYAFSAGNEKAAKAVWYTSMRGTYVITPEHLKGDRAVRFFGVPPDAQAQPADAAPMAPEPMK